MGNRDRLNGGSRNARNEGERRRSLRWAHIIRLLYPGVGLKRWLLVGALGVAAWSVGVAFLSRRIFEVRFPEFLPSNGEGFLLIGAGILATMAALYGMYRSVGSIVFAARTFDSLADTIYTRRSRGRGLSLRGSPRCRFALGAEGLRPRHRSQYRAGRTRSPRGRPE